MNMERVLKEKRDVICAIASEHGAYNVRIFGSVVRGEAGPDSDIDVERIWEITQREIPRLKEAIVAMLEKEFDAEYQ